jgi:hypothetical protein
VVEPDDGVRRLARAAGRLAAAKGQAGLAAVVLELDPDTARDVVDWLEKL